MSDKKMLSLTFGETYDSYDDSFLFMENFKQHMLEKDILSRNPEVLDDLVNNAERLVPQLMMMAEALETDEIQDKVNHALCITRIAMRIAAYYATEHEMENSNESE